MLRYQTRGLLLSIMLVTAGTLQTAASTETSEGMEVAELLHQVQVGLVHAQNRLGPDMPKLKKVQLELETHLANEGGGKVKLFVISAGANISETTAQKVVLSLAPPDAFAEVESAAPQLSDIFAESVVAAVKGTHQAAQRKPPLELGELTSEIKFTLQKKGGGGLGFTIMPVTIELGGDVSSTSIQKLLVTFGK